MDAIRPETGTPVSAEPWYNSHLLSSNLVPPLVNNMNRSIKYLCMIGMHDCKTDDFDSHYSITISV